MKAVFLKISKRAGRGLLLLYAILSCPAFAHHPMGGKTPTTVWQGILSGLAHPVIELDHLLFLIGIAVATAIARVAPKQALSLLAAFGLAGALGTVMRVSDVSVAFADFAVATSLLLLGLWLWTTRLPRFAIAGLWIFGGLFHGYAYGEAVIGSEITPLAAYLCGLAVIQALLMAGTYLLINHFATATNKRQRHAERALGGIVSAMALWMLWGLA